MEQYSKIIHWLVFTVLCIGAGLPAARVARAVTGPESNVFDFERFTIDDVLRRQAKTGGIKIRLNRPPSGGVIGGKYRGDDPEQVIRDIFRRDNVTIEWLYNQGRLEEVLIRLYDSPGDAGPGGAAAAPDGDAYNTAGLRTQPYSVPIGTVHAETARYRSDAPEGAAPRGGGGVADNHVPESVAFSAAVAGQSSPSPGLVSGGASGAIFVSGTGKTGMSGTTKPLAASAAKRVLEPPPMPPGFPD